MGGAGHRGWNGDRHPDVRPPTAALEHPPDIQTAGTPTTASTAPPSTDVGSTGPSSTTGLAGQENRYLSDLLFTQRKGCGRPANAEVSIGGESYRSVTIVAQKCSGGGSNYLECTIPPGCQALTAALGLPDTSAEDDRALIEVSTDGGQRETFTMQRNRGERTTLSLTDALHVRLTMQNLSPEGFRDLTVAFGDAKMVCSS